MKNSIQITPSTSISYQYKPERDELAVQLRAATGAVSTESVPESEYVRLQRESQSGEVVGFTVTSVQQMLLEQLVRSVFTQLQPHFPAPTTTEIAPSPVPATSELMELATPATTDNTETLTQATGYRDQKVETDAVSEITPATEGGTEAATPVAEETAAEKSGRNRRRRNRGRGNGNAAAAENTETADTSDSEGVSIVDDAAVVPVAEHTPEATIEAAPEAETPEAPKAPSRRRRGKKTEAVAEAPAQQEFPAEVVAPATVGNDDADAQAAPSETPTADTAETPPDKNRRRRSRKKKGEAQDETDHPFDVAPVADTTATPAETESYFLSTTDGDAEDDSEEEPLTAEGDTSGESGRRKRRRKRKKRDQLAPPAADAAPPDNALPTAATPVADPVDAPAVATSWSFKAAPIPGMDAPDDFLFMGLNPVIGQAIHAFGYETPTPIQRRAVPEALAGKDIIGLAQTGTGKTMAFLLPALHRMLEKPSTEHRPRLLVLTPTRELALQVANEADMVAIHTDFLVTTIYGQEDMKRQVRALKDGVDVIVATPGRLLDHLNRGTARLNNVEVVVMDEADRMLDMGFIPDIRNILSRLPRIRQTMMFSATMPAPIQSLSLEFQREPVIIEVARQLPPSQIDQKLYTIEKHLKVPLLAHLLNHNVGMRSVMIFTETKAEADIVYNKLRDLGFESAIMHGDRSQRERERALESLRTGTVRMLVATNVAARGLDIRDITHVINYDVPQTVDDYVHRIGRTARGEGAEGTAMTFVTLGDEPMIKRIESALERALPRERAEGFNYDVPTPSWAKPSADQITASLTKPKNIAERFGRMLRRR